LIRHTDFGILHPFEPRRSFYLLRCILGWDFSLNKVYIPSRQYCGMLHPSLGRSIYNLRYIVGYFKSPFESGWLNTLSSEQGRPVYTLWCLVGYNILLHKESLCGMFHPSEPHPLWCIVGHDTPVNQVVLYNLFATKCMYLPGLSKFSKPGVFAKTCRPTYNSWG
ncbi:unnamed protein product, partial [Owenia fusiformis]